jgi:hypothetical protein
MEITEALIADLGGEYFKEGLKKSNSPYGSVISQNSFGIVNSKEYSIKFYCFDNKGVRNSGAFDGSPFKISLILPFELSKKPSIHPKSFFRSVILPLVLPSLKQNGNKDFLKKYKLSGSKGFEHYFMKHKDLSKMVSSHNIFISSRIDNGLSILSLRPNESVITKEDLKKLYDIMDELGKLITQNKQHLKN